MYFREGSSLYSCDCDEMSGPISICAHMCQGVMVFVDFFYLLRNGDEYTSVDFSAMFPPIASFCLLLARRSFVSPAPMISRYEQVQVQVME